MIDIKRKEDCVGCNACVQRCPKQCISMSEDEQGFLYPTVNLSECIECGLCEKVCPVINQANSREPLAAYAAKNKDKEIQKNSSSGGVFYSLAKTVIDEGGVVFGARFNDKWEVIHDYTETIEVIKAFQTSKYVQSRTGETFLKAERFLKEGRKVLFSGTPCQIAGLKRFLRKEYENLLAVDVVCHGVPSPLVWRKYLDFVTRPKGVSKNTESQSSSHHSNDIPDISGISFRDKRLGWEKYGIAIRYAAPKGGRNSESQSAISNKEDNPKDFFECHRENLFMQCFLKDLCLRPSCYECPAKSGKSHSDITLADYWGIQKSYPQYHDAEGVSLILCSSNNGQRCFQSIQDTKKSKIVGRTALDHNPAFWKSANKPAKYSRFWQLFLTSEFQYIPSFLRNIRPPFIKRMRNKIFSLIPKQIKHILKSKFE